ncbi:uncharacterized protein LOC121865930 [Homarus americanus]|nr:uncharacterized protein LOC121865930 [Homarus americanus]
MCALIRPLVEEASGTVFFYTTNNMFMMTEIYKYELRLTVRHNQFVFNARLLPDAWNPVCVGYHSGYTQVWAALRGEFLNVKTVHSVDYTRRGYKLCLGAPLRDTKTPTFVGDVAAVLVVAEWPRLKLPNLATCDTLVSDSVASSILGHTWRGVGHLLRVDYNQEEFCSGGSHTHWVKVPGGYTKTRDTCQSLGGHVATRQEATYGRVTVADKTCITDDLHVSWLGHDHQDPGPLAARCPTLLVNGTIGSRSCLDDLECSVCGAPVWLRYTLYGDVPQFDRYFFLRTLSDGSSYFQGVDTSQITLTDGWWVLSSRVHRHTWRLTSDPWPVGRHLWYCGHTTTTLTLTSCTMAQFSSHSGHCLPRSRRCNSIHDFPDGSDEERCQERLVERPHDYDTLTPPTNSNNEPIQVSYMFTVNNIQEISTTPETAVVDMTITLCWHDPRLRIWDGPRLTVFPCSRIWYPEVGGRAGDGTGGEINLRVDQRGCYVNDLNTRYDLNDPLMGRVRHGADTLIYMNQQLRLKSPCYGEPYLYPYGNYECNVSFYMKSFNMEDRLQAQHPTGRVNYVSKTRRLLGYRLLGITFENESSCGTLTVHLRSEFEYHILNTLAPSVLVVIICYSSLFFPLGSFTDRIMVSLGALLVLAALFSQISGFYVSTPYYRLLDMWYASLISLCFIIVMVNMMVNCLQQKRTQHTLYSLVSSRSEQDASQESLRSPPERGAHLNMACKVLLLALFTAGAVIFTLLATNVI